MKKIQVKMRAAVVINHAAGSTAEVIVDGGVMYYPAIESADFGGDSVKPTKSKASTDAEDEDEPAPKKSVTKSTGKKSAKVLMTDEEIGEMDEEQLEQLLKNIGEDPDDYDGKASHKKNVAIAIGVQPDDGFDAKDLPEDAGEEAEEAEDEKPAKKKIISKKKDEEEEEADDDDEKPAKKAPSKGAKKESKPDIIKDFTDLEKGDKVIAYFKELEEDYEGKVISVKGEDVSVKWSDGDTSVLNTDDHSKVRRVQ